MSKKYWAVAFITLLILTCFGLAAWHAPLSDETGMTSETHEIVAMHPEYPSRVYAVVNYGEDFVCTAGGIMHVDAVLWLDITQRNEDGEAYWCYVRPKGYYNTDTYNL